MSDSAPGRSKTASTLQAMLDAGDTEVFRRLVESVRDYAIFLLTPEGRVASWNPGAQRIKGYRADEIIGKSFHQFYTADALARGWPEEELRRAAADGRVEDEGLRVRKDGTSFWANVTITALRSANGDLLGYSKVTRDLTERRVHEQRLAQSERNLRLLVEGVQDHAMFLLDIDGRIQTWNVGASRVFGLDAGQALGHDSAILLPADARSAGVDSTEFDGARAAGHLQTQGWRIKGDGTEFWADVTTTALFEPDGTPRGYAQIVRDLSERRRVEQLEDEGRRIGEFIAMLSHELRNPLAPMRSALAVIDQHARTPETAWSIDMVGRQVAHLSRLVDDLLDLSRISSGKIRLDTAPLQFDELVRMAVDSARSVLQAHEHTLNLSLPSKPVTVDGDATRLTQVVYNLLHNAAKYTPAGGRIEVTLKADGPLATMQVSDNGIGMTDVLLQHVFEPFVQGERALDRAQGGLGIGLALVKSVVELHGGSVVASSAGTGLGSTVTVTLPTAAAGTAVPAPAADAGTAAVPAARHVLLVDDNKDAADSLAMLLGMSGHEVQVAYDGPGALAFAAARLPHTVLLDIGLPGISGLEVAARLRALPGSQAMHIVALTGYGQEQDRASTAAAGCDAHLTKPVDIDELFALLERLA